jgi:hypothetical protein
MDGFDAKFTGTFYVALIIIQKQSFLRKELTFLQHLFKNFRIRFSLLHAMGIVRAMEKVIQRVVMVHARKQNVVNVLHMNAVCVT